MHGVDEHVAVFADLAVRLREVAHRDEAVFGSSEMENYFGKMPSHTSIYQELIAIY